MPADQRLLAWVAEAMAPVGTVTHRAMMGGATLYCEGVVFAIVDGDGLWFKANKLSDAAWDAIGAERFSYDRKGEAATMNYRRAPDAVYDDGDALRHLAGLALAAGARAPVRKRRG